MMHHPVSLTPAWDRVCTPPELSFPLKLPPLVEWVLAQRSPADWARAANPLDDMSLPP